MRIKNPEIRQRQWNKVLAHLYYIDHPGEFNKPFIDEYKDIIEFIENDMIKVHPRCMDAGCRKVSTSLILHHEDGNPYNDSIENIKILCKSCNAQARNWGIHGGSKLGKKPEKHSIGERERNRAGKFELEGGKPIVRMWETLRSIECEERFYQWLDKIFTNGESMDFDDVSNGGANEVGCSAQTAVRYLKKKSNSINGIYEIFTDDAGIKMIRRRGK